MTIAMSEDLGKLIKELGQWSPGDLKIVVMPHFCVDCSVKYEGGHTSFVEKLEVIRKQEGGNIIVDQSMFLGGKAANCASALASLGLNTHLIARTSELGYKLLKYFTGGKVDISHVIKDGKLAITTAIELPGSNIMLSDPGSLSNFGPDHLSARDEELVQEADFVCISDWGLNCRGTELAKHVFEKVKEGKGKKGKTYFDPGDPSPKARVEQEISALVELLMNGLVDIFGVNEDELLRYGQTNEPHRAVDFLSKMTRVDFHTKDHVASFQRDGETGKVPTFNVEPLRLTGAGDAWNAGNILGDAMGLSSELRLVLANAVAAYYISNPHGVHPGIEELIEFLEKIEKLEN
ncbi:MAG: carbohydrate kinase family protein [Archaeoglobaceae archaeon]